PFVAEPIPNIVQKISAPGFSIQEFPILLLRKLEVAIDLAAAEAQVEDALPAIICRRGEQLRFKMLPLHIRSPIFICRCGKQPRQQACTDERAAPARPPDQATPTPDIHEPASSAVGKSRPPKAQRPPSDPP